MTPKQPEDHPSIWSALREVEFRQGFVDTGPVEGGTVRTRYVESGTVDSASVLMVYST